MEIKFKQITKKGVVNINLPVEVDYIVNRDKRTVVAIARPVGDEAFRVAERFMPNASFEKGMDLHMVYCKNSRFFEELIMPQFCRATAHCHPEDEFSVEEGIVIVAKKMEAKLKQMIINRVKRIGADLVNNGQAMQTIE